MDDERETAQLRERHDPLPLDPHHGHPPKPTAPVCEPQATVSGLLGDHTSLRRPTVSPYLEDIPEIHRATELDPHLDRHAGLVGKHDILFHAPAERAPPHHAHTLWPHAGGKGELGLRASHPGSQRDQPSPPDPEAEFGEVPHVPVEETPPGRTVEVAHLVRNAIRTRRHNAHEPVPHTPTPVTPIDTA
jgi:hypothetical protein